MKPVIAQIDCPYCSTKQSGFQVQGWFRRHEASTYYPGQGDFYSYEDWLLKSCGNCRQTVSGVYKYHGKKQKSIELWKTSHGDPSSIEFKYHNHFPKMVTMDEPRFVPDKVLVPFRQAISNLSSLNWDAAGTMARKTLDIATKDLARSKYSDEDTKTKLLKMALHHRIR